MFKFKYLFNKEWKYINDNDHNSMVFYLNWRSFNVKDIIINDIIPIASLFTQGTLKLNYLTPDIDKLN